MPAGRRRARGRARPGSRAAGRTCAGRPGRARRGPPPPAGDRAARAGYRRPAPSSAAGGGRERGRACRPRPARCARSRPPTPGEGDQQRLGPRVRQPTQPQHDGQATAPTARRGRTRRSPAVATRRSTGPGVTEHGAVQRRPDRGHARPPRAAAVQLRARRSRVRPVHGQPHGRRRRSRGRPATSRGTSPRARPAAPATGAGGRRACGARRRRDGGQEIADHLGPHREPALHRVQGQRRDGRATSGSAGRGPRRTPRAKSQH